MVCSGNELHGCAGDPPGEKVCEMEHRGVVPVADKDMGWYMDLVEPARSRGCALTRVELAGSLLENLRRILADHGVEPIEAASGQGIPPQLVEVLDSLVDIPRLPCIDGVLGERLISLNCRLPSGHVIVVHSGVAGGDQQSAPHSLGFCQRKVERNPPSHAPPPRSAVDPCGGGRINPIGL